MDGKRFPNEGAKVRFLLNESSRCNKKGEDTALDGIIVRDHPVGQCLYPFLGLQNGFI